MLCEILTMKKCDFLKYQINFQIIKFCFFIYIYILGVGGGDGGTLGINGLTVYIYQ